ncbi:MAG: aspartyl protease family protein [Chitinophagaceae bacterium]|nr:aspartyl protease family protein [Chitinophagaceae bacterium]
MKRLLISYVLAGIFTQALSQHPGTAQRLTSIPFTLLPGGIVILQAGLDSFQDSLNFILDTGSSGISLDSSTAERLGVKPEPSEKIIRGIAGFKKVSFLNGRTLRFPGLRVDSLNFHINDYSILTSLYGIRIDGIIGYALLSRYIVHLNYDSLKLTFFSPGSIRYPKIGHLLKPNIHQLVGQKVEIRDKKQIRSQFLFDIGAGLCVLFSTRFVEDSQFFQKRRKRWIKSAEGIGGKIDMELTIIRELKIGPYRFRNVPSLIFNDTFNITSYPQMAGLLGNDILRRFNIYLNYPAREIFISPNTHFYDAFDYSYSGLELYMMNDKIIIGDVARGSPAEEAGLQQGDEIIAINQFFNQNLSQYKLALQVPDQRVKIIFRRNEKLYEVSFKVKNILH